MISDTSSPLSVALTLFIPLSLRERGASPPSLKLLPLPLVKRKGIKGIGLGLPKSGTDYPAKCH
jgi:hypothetical protein